MKLQITIDMGNGAFGDDMFERATEASRCINEYLRRAVSDGMQMYDASLIWDINGNKIGTAEVMP